MREEGFESKVLVIKTDTGYAYRIVTVGLPNDVDETHGTVYRTRLHAYRAGHEAIYAQVLGELTGP